MNSKFNIGDRVALVRKQTVIGRVVGITKPIFENDEYSYEVDWDEMPSRIAARTNIPEQKLYQLVSS